MSRLPYIRPRRIRSRKANMNDTVRNENVIAALRLARVSCGDEYERFGRIAERIIAEAPETLPENRGGVELLLSMQSAGELRFEVDVDA